MSTRGSLAPVLALLVAANVAGHALGPRWHVPLGLALTAALAAAARAAGLTAGDLGLDQASRPAGLRWGGAAAAAVAVGYLLALAVAPIRSAVAGSARPWPEVAAAVLVTIPLGTVLAEEVAFRGLLPALLTRLVPARRAIATSAALFGLWHVLAAASGGGAANASVSGAVGGGSGAVVVRVVVTVVFTAAAGLLLSVLRERSGSLLAPMLLHWAVNAGGVLLVRLA